MSPIPPAIHRILETSLYVEGLDRSTAFYERVFGFEVMLRDDRMCAMAVPARQVLLLFRKGGSTRPSETPFGLIPPHDGQGTQHLCFSIPHSALDVWQKHLQDLEAVMDLRVSSSQVHGMEIARKPYPSDVSDEEWTLVAPYLTLLPEDAGQRDYPLREAFNGLRYIIKTGAQWRSMPHDLPPWPAIYQQAQRWLATGCFEALLDDLRALLREALGRSATPSAAIIDSRTLRSSPESGERAGYDGAKRKRGSKLHMAVDTLGNLLALSVTAANVDDRAEVSNLTRTVQAVTDNTVDVAFVDQGYNGPNAAEAAQANGVELIVVKLPEAKKGFVLLPRRWVVERSFAWATRFRRLVRDYERYASTLAGFHLIAFVCLMLKQIALLAAAS